MKQWLIMKQWDTEAQYFYDIIKSALNGLQAGRYIKLKTFGEILDYIQIKIDKDQEEDNV